jgi:hypothetical protein
VTTDPPTFDAASDRITYESTKHHGSDDVNTTDGSSENEMESEPVKGLMPCPFCGEPGEVRPATSRVPDYPFAATARCTDCHTSACGISQATADECAAAAWNRRVPAPQAPAEPHPQRPQEQDAAFRADCELAYQAEIREVQAERDAAIAGRTAAVEAMRADRDEARELHRVVASQQRHDYARAVAAQATAERLRGVLALFDDGCSRDGELTCIEARAPLCRGCAASAALSSSAEAPRQHQEGTTAERDHDRCACYGWPLDPSGRMCRRGDCSMRPLPLRLYDADRYRREKQPQAGDNDKGKAAP